MKRILGDDAQDQQEVLDEEELLIIRKVCNLCSKKLKEKRNTQIRLPLSRRLRGPLVPQM